MLLAACCAASTSKPCAAASPLPAHSCCTPCQLTFRCHSVLDTPAGWLPEARPFRTRADLSAATLQRMKEWAHKPDTLCFQGALAISAPWYQIGEWGVPHGARVQERRGRWILTARSEERGMACLHPSTHPHVRMHTHILRPARRFGSQMTYLPQPRRCARATQGQPHALEHVNRRPGPCGDPGRAHEPPPRCR